MHIFIDFLFYFMAHICAQLLASRHGALYKNYVFNISLKFWHLSEIGIVIPIQCDQYYLGLIVE